MSFWVSLSKFFVYVFRFSYPFLPLMRSDSERIYVRFHSEEYEKKHINDIKISEKGFSGLLGDQKEQIWATAREIVSIRSSFLLDFMVSKRIGNEATTKKTD